MAGHRAHLQTLLTCMAPGLGQVKGWTQSRLSMGKPTHGLSVWLGLPYCMVVLGSLTALKNSPKLQECMSQQTRKKLRNLLSPALEVTEHRFCPGLLNKAVTSMPRLREGACLHLSVVEASKNHDNVF